MQDEKNTSTSQFRSEEELAERIVSLINDTAEQLDGLLKDVGKSEDTMQKFFDKVDGKTIQNAELLQEFSRIVMQGTMANMVKKAIAEVEQKGTRHKDAFANACRTIGLDAEIIELGTITSEE